VNTGKGKEPKRKFPVLIVVSTTVFVSFLLSFFLGQSGVFRLRQLQADYDRMQMENYRMALENRQLAEEIKQLRHSPAAIEKIAREELHFASPHDIVLITPEQQPQKPEPPQDH
jgi:cell division protein FtsB